MHVPRKTRWLITLVQACLTGLLVSTSWAGPVAADHGQAPAGQDLVEPANPGASPAGQSAAQRGAAPNLNGGTPGSGEPTTASASASRPLRGKLSAAEADKARAVLGLAPAAARLGASQAHRVGAVPETETAASLDPELKETLKEARDWVKGAAGQVLPQTLQFDRIGSPPGLTEDPAVAPRGLRATTGGPEEAAGPGPVAGTGDAIGASTQPPVGPPANVLTNVFDLAVEIVSHPGVWAVAGLVLLGKLMFALLRRKVARQSARLRHQARLQGVAARKVSSAAGSADDTTRHTGRGRTRQRRGQREQSQG
jgi:hypothetical protein